MHNARNPKKKQRLEGRHQEEASLDDLGVDVLANIYGFLPSKDIMCKRCINKKTMEAAKTTIVPPTKFVVNTLDSYNAMRVMTEALPNLQQITLCDLGQGLMFEPPDWGHIGVTGRIQIKRGLLELPTSPHMILK